MPHILDKEVLFMAKKKEFTCTVEVTEGFPQRLTCALVDIYYQRKRKTVPREKNELHDDKTA